MTLPVDIPQQVMLALAEDCGDGDLSAAMIDAEAKCQAVIISREPMVMCGQAWVEETYYQLDSSITIDWQVDEGQWLDVPQTLAIISGPSQSILTGERTALNFLQLLSATATTTKAYVDVLTHTSTRLLDTRKTIPGLRLAQKYAVACGGGTNHRMGLYDAIMIKENHVQSAGSITQAVERARLASPEVMLEVEVENLHELDEALALNVDRIMLDNFSDAMLEEALKKDKGSTEYELSGNVSLATLADRAREGIDYISVGALTKHVQAIDLSLRFVEEKA